tara:strand:+ start:1488 stop:2339 length:852 start_codon:yes stop_codon:yes gene_type:complete
MILIDNNQLIISSIFIAMKHSDIEDKNTLRHLIVNTYRFYNQKFKKEYGDMIICHDSSHCWRKDIFEQYKSNRKSAKAKSPHDWNKIFDTMTSIRNEIEENFPWKNVSVERTEADDIIAVIAENSSPMESVLIISSDKDFQQLQKYSNVKQWSPLKKDFLVCEDPKEFLLEHIIKGDSSDGIPNILSDGDTFVCEDKRQKPCGKKKIEVWKTVYKMGELHDHVIQSNWVRNETMIDFDKIPKDIKENILKEYNKEHKPNKGKIFPYLVENGLSKLIEVAEELY